MRILPPQWNLNWYQKAYCWALMATVFIVIVWVVLMSAGCAASGIRQVFYGGPPFHVLHPDRDDDCQCDRFHEWVCDVEETAEYLTREQEKPQ